MFALLSLLAGAAPSAPVSAAELRCEYRVDPLGVDTAVSKPRLSWVLSSNGTGAVQKAYEVKVSGSLDALKRGEASLWDSGKVESDASVGVEYGGSPLKDGQRAYWTVTVWNGDGEAHTSKPATWEMGLSAGSWTAKWVSEPSVSVPYLRKEFGVEGKVVKARLYATALGLYRFTLDGKPVGKGELTPGWTDFHKRVAYQTYDVTGMLKGDKHALGLRLANGWYAGHVGWTEAVYGKFPLAMAQLVITYADGHTDTVNTDGSWKAGSGPIATSDCQMGEVYDARKELPGWDKVGFNDSGWSAPDVTDRTSLELIGQQGPMVEKWDELGTKKITEPKPGTYIFDLGQNMVGWAKLKVAGAAGDKVTLRFGEVLNPDGTLYTTNLRKAKATEIYTLKGNGVEVYEPSFTFHGFRYVEVTGYPGVPTTDAIRGEVVGSALPATGTFACSNPLVNQLEHNIYWGMRGNYLDVPTDCPQRDERLGWMGDAETFIPTADFLADVDGFMTKWTQDVQDGQSGEGGFTDVSPAMLFPPHAAPAWGDAGVIVPWNVYLAYDDKRLLAERYDSMKAWIDYIDRANPSHLWLKERGNDYGDWLNINDETPHEIVATAFYANSADIVAKAAAVLGKTEDADHYRNLHAQIVKAFQQEFVQNGWAIKGDTQTDYVLAIVFGLEHLTEMDANRRIQPSKAYGNHLADLVVNKAHDHLSSGFVGVGRLMPALTETGHSDVAYKLLLQTTFPSWGYPITQGATTIWERWDGYRADKGFQDPGMNSFNHYSLGSVGEWMYNTVAGIMMDPEFPGYKHFFLQPHPGAGLTWAAATFDSVHGKISSKWKQEGKKLVLDFEIPANTTATLRLPKCTLEGDYKTDMVELDGAAGISVEFGSGKYHLVADL